MFHACIFTGIEMAFTSLEHASCMCEYAQI